jgi:hypothetical protein
MAVSHVEPQNVSSSFMADKILQPIVNIATKTMVAGY